MALPTLTLYTRPGCALCEQAAHHLSDLEFRFTPVNIDVDPDLRARWSEHVPVLTWTPAGQAEQVLGKGSFSRGRLGQIKLHLLRLQP
ncbi:glutaredoxin family protein [Deinococcus radiotolerans]|uniref:NrdH-redoxin n=1 Tax=Deinococcus radiotolerans TaxID=1309407 RepID=A0ABQ2FGE7_9DEIO|nr:glutaredoxin family protein [Deinococcus radiotolerans]GGK86904.1 NrdH-redoxin [Deinococcus radiotolerans]